jgi:branched-chain amino acid transport system permease protein
VAADRPVRESSALSRRDVIGFGIAAVVAAVLAVVPLVVDSYYLALGISLLSYIVLATAWALFSGPTRYISLATVAFFGVGAYTVGVLGEVLPWPLVLLIAAAVGVAMALVVGLSTLRLSGMYFVIFTFGLSELVRQVVTWYEVNVHRSVGRYIFVDITQAQIYWQLLALAVLVFATGWWIGRSRLGLALRVIGEDEVVAHHCGIDTTRAKLTLFALSAVFTTVTGAVMAPRWTYIDPAIVFNPMLSFQVVIMALFGGAAVLFGPLFGVIPLVLLFELLSAHFPNYFSILLGITFMLVVYAVPNGVAGLVSAGWTRTFPQRASV